jgi:hypothetical protein
MEIWTQAQESGFLTKKIRKNVNKKEKTVAQWVAVVLVVVKLVPLKREFQGGSNGAKIIPIGAILTTL